MRRIVDDTSRDSDNDPFYSKRQAAVFVILSFLAAAIFPLTLWLSWSGILRRETVLISFGVAAVVVATLFKHLPLGNDEPRSLPLRDRFRLALSVLGVPSTAADTAYRILVIVPISSLIALILFPRSGSSG